MHKPLVSMRLVEIGPGAYPPVQRSFLAGEC
jgi:hypothetical protein